jgi:DNA polymerase-4
VHTKIPNPKSMGHGKVMPPNTTEEIVVETYLMHMCEKLAARLRGHHFQAQHFFAGVHSREIGWLGTTGQTMQPTHDGREIFQLALFLLQQTWQGEPVWKIQVTALDPRSGGYQLDLLVQENDKRSSLNRVLDEINDRYGEFTIAPATLLQRSKMPNVIAPAWKPIGHRQTI